MVNGLPRLLLEVILLVLALLIWTRLCVTQMRLVQLGCQGPNSVGLGSGRLDFTQQGGGALAVLSWSLLGLARLG